MGLEVKGRKLDTKQRGQEGRNTDLERTVGHKDAAGTRIWVVGWLTESLREKGLKGERPRYKDCVFSGRPSTWQGHEG